MKRALFFLLAMFALPLYGQHYLAPVEFDDDSVILRMALFDSTDQNVCPASDATNDDVIIRVSSDASAGHIDTYGPGSANDLDTITTIGTFETPDANSARFEVIAAGSCMYELHLLNSIFATTNATQLQIEVVNDGAGPTMDIVYYVDLTPVSSANLIDDIWDELCSGHTTTDTLGDQLCAIVDAILADTGTTLDNKLDNIQTATDRLTAYSSTIDTVTSQTVLVAAAGPAEDDTHRGWPICVIDADNNDTDCAAVLDYDAGTTTWTLERNLVFTVAVSDVIYAPIPMALALNSDFLHCEINTANFAGSTTTLACILQDANGTAVTQATDDLLGKVLVIRSGADIRETRYINDTTWDSGNSELQITLDSALPSTQADGVTAVIF